MSDEPVLLRSGIRRTRPQSALNGVRIGPVRLPLSAFALSLSVVLHATFFGGFLAVSGSSPAPDTPPEVLLAHGETAPQVRVTLIPWPYPPPDEESPTEPPQRTPADEESPEPSPTVTIPPHAELPEQLPEPEAEIEIDQPEEPLTDPEEMSPTPVLVEQEPQTVEDPEPNDATPEALPERELAPEIKPEPAELEPTTNEPQPVAKEPAPPQDTPDEQPTPEAPETPETPEVAETPEAPEDTPAGVETGVEVFDLPKPRYPRLSRRRGEEGLVLLEIDVLPDGSVGGIAVVEGPGFSRLVEAAIESVKKARFKPATRDGKPVRAGIRIPFRFVLR